MEYEIMKGLETIKIVTIPSKKCVYGKKGFPECGCNDCIDAITEYAGFKKEAKYFYKGEEVVISSFCPLPHCCDIFIHKPNTGFCEWLTLEEAREKLRLVS